MAQDAVEDGRFEEATNHLTEVCVFVCVRRGFDWYLLGLWFNTRTWNPMTQNWELVKKLKA